MNSGIGFYLSFGCNRNQIAVDAINRLLSHFDDLESLEINIGMSLLILWGRGDLNQCVHELPDGSRLALIGSPVGKITWTELDEKMQQVHRAADFELPWEGRCILIKISPDGSCWTMWNDWVGSIPIFHSTMGESRLASTLENVLVETAGLTANDFFLPAIVSLLTHGHLISDWTLFKGLKIVPADCVAEWEGTRFNFRNLDTVPPTDARWTNTWNDLVDEMYELSRQAIKNVLQTQSRWVLPLSGGYDSRLIAAVGAEMGTEMHAYTFGDDASMEVIGARKIARLLHIPWKKVELGGNFLVEHMDLWRELFGSSLHFHGMHQIEFLERIAMDGTHGGILSGFMGDVLAGAFVALLDQSWATDPQYQLAHDWFLYWKREDIHSLVKFPLEDIFNQIAHELLGQKSLVGGATYRKLLYLLIWNRERLFVSFQSTLNDYWGGAANPYMDRTYARFCFSLPRAILCSRRLFFDMYRRYYFKLSTLPNTRFPDPLILTGRYLLRKRIAQMTPFLTRWSPFREFNPVQYVPELKNVTLHGKQVFWPIFEKLDELAEWFDKDRIQQAYAQISDHDSVRKVQCLQPIAYRLVR